MVNVYVPFTGGDINAEYITWLLDNVNDNNWDFWNKDIKSGLIIRRLGITFKDEQDAIMFKLRFGL